MKFIDWVLVISVLAFCLLVVYSTNEEIIKSPCSDGYSVDERRTIDGQLYFRCCNSDYEIKRNAFVEKEDCQILKAKPGLFEGWFE